MTTICTQMIFIQILKCFHLRMFMLPLCHPLTSIFASWLSASSIKLHLKLLNRSLLALTITQGLSLSLSLYVFFFFNPTKSSILLTFLTSLYKPSVVFFFPLSLVLVPMGQCENHFCRCYQFCPFLYSLVVSANKTQT